MRKETLLTIASTAIALLGGELFLERWFPQLTVQQALKDRPAMYRSSDVLFMELLPDFQGTLRESEFDTSIRVNSLGYRQDEFKAQKGQGLRIVVVGDSFTFGYGVEERDSYPRVLERLLAEVRTRNELLPVEVINAGVPAWWTDAYYLYLKEYGLALEPDLILLGLFMGNDIDGPDARSAIWPRVDAEGLPLQIGSTNTQIEKGRRVHVKRRSRWKFPLLRDSHVFQLLYTAQRNMRRALKPTIKARSLYQPFYSPQTKTIVEQVMNLIGAMVRLSQRHGARFVVVMLPERGQVSAASKATYGELDFDKPQRLFAEFFKKQNIAYLDLLPTLRAAADNTALYFQYDSHLSVEGNRLAGREIAKYLVASGLLSAPPLKAPQVTGRPVSR